MGIFGKKEQINLSDPGEVDIAEHVASALPDVGDYFLNWIGDICNEQVYALLKADIDARRAPNGWVAGKNFADVPPMGRKQLPMSMLHMLFYTSFSLPIWGTAANRGKDYNALKSTLSSLVDTQGHAAAATWAIIARPDARFNLEILSKMLQDEWSENLGVLRNKDVIKAFRNWSK
ncbi:hypothetical protein ACN3XK_15130 [Actinomadura welshii]